MLKLMQTKLVTLNLDQVTKITDDSSAPQSLKVYSPPTTQSLDGFLYVSDFVVTTVAMWPITQIHAGIALSREGIKTLTDYTPCRETDTFSICPGLNSSFSMVYNTWSS
ncbi:hypothetical protein TNCT_314561 [Trichonephila clavata]|uniref:Uncharacterized protein n=1 Tax=Trichonephila clavata TaxID=2740835 RepID=A0A8X6FPU4_TRICU|nr:hypothetical protein TNCT_314561 [Trichonephila clavata]